MRSRSPVVAPGTALDRVHHVPQRSNEHQGNRGRHEVEDKMRKRQSPALEIRTERAQYRGDRRTDIGPDRQGQSVLVGHLPGDQSRDDDHQRAHQRNGAALLA